jgi:hypothetical protein
LRVNSILGASVLAAAALVSAAPPETADPEDELKAATVLAFLQNSKWPDGAAAGPHLTVGVVGRPEFAQVLRRLIEGKSVGGRGVRVQVVGFPIDPRCCRVFYVATERRLEIERALSGAAGAHVLTIGDSSRFLDEGGAINLFFSDGHMAFEVSLAALEQCGVSISSKLLRFGRVRDLPKTKGPG